MIIEPKIDNYKKVSMRKPASTRSIGSTVANVKFDTLRLAIIFKQKINRFSQYRNIWLVYFEEFVVLILIGEYKL